MSDPLTGPLQLPAIRWQDVDPPIYQQTAAALGYRPPSRVMRVMRDASRGASRAGMTLETAMAGFRISLPRNVWTRFGRACRQSGIENPIRPTAYHAELSELDSWRPLR